MAQPDVRLEAKQDNSVRAQQEVSPLGSFGHIKADWPL
jgi:hypothetical protein